MRSDSPGSSPDSIQCSGVAVCWSGCSGAAPARSSTSTTFAWPFNAARMRGVEPSLSAWLTLADTWMRPRTHCR
eukprot:6515251-Prymnesium_polylepis.1